MRIIGSSLVAAAGLVLGVAVWLRGSRRVIVWPALETEAAYAGDPGLPPRIRPLARRRVRPVLTAIAGLVAGGAIGAGVTWAVTAARA